MVSNLECGMQIHKAIVHAAMAHKGQVRKGSDLDYISHPMEVLQILAGMDSRLELLLAGILHDVVEDTATTKEELVDMFGDEVADLVAHHTQNQDLTWQERKQEALDKAASGSRENKLLMLADRLSNARSMYMDYVMIGDQLWERFNAPKESQKWYMDNTLKVLECFKMDTLAGRYYRELSELNAALFG